MNDFDVVTGPAPDMPPKPKAEAAKVETDDDRHEPANPSSMLSRESEKAESERP